MIGTRIDWDGVSDNPIPQLGNVPGSYGKDKDGIWWAHVPCPLHHFIGVLSNHTVVEHEDGTITVSPSILVPGDQGYHGYLEHGVWREV